MYSKNFLPAFTDGGRLMFVSADSIDAVAEHDKGLEVWTRNQSHLLYVPADKEWALCAWEDLLGAGRIRRLKGKEGNRIAT